MTTPATLSSVPAQTPYIQYVATSGQTIFPYPFEITQDSDLVVVANGVTLATDSGYTVSGVGASTGGNATFTSGRTAGDIITLYRDIPISRVSQIAQNSGFSSAVFNAEFNNIYLLLQQLQSGIDQCLQIPNTNNPAPTVSLTPGAYANKYLAFDANGNPEPADLTSSGSLTASIIGALTSVANAVPFLTSLIKSPAEIAANVTVQNFGYKPLNILRYYSGSGTHDTALANAIAVASQQNGGTIRAPGSYTFANQVALNTKTSIIIQGDGAATGGVAAATVFTYTGTGSSYWINMDSSVGCQIRGIQLQHSSASFTGTYVQCNNDGTHGDPAFCGIFDCVLGANVSNTTHLNLNKCTLFTAERCNFIYGNPSVLGMAAGGYSNVIRFRDCEWNNSAVAPVQGGGQSWTFDSCSWESLANGNAGAIFSTSSSTIFDGLVVKGCWFGDESNTSSAASWIDIYGAACLIAGNYISGNSSTTHATGITLRQSSAINITANNFTSLSAGVNFAVANCIDIVLQANEFNSVTTVVQNGNNVPTGSLIWGPNFGVGSSPPSSNHGTNGANGCEVNAAAGIIHQWGTLSVTSGAGATAFTFPLQFPNACYGVWPSVSPNNAGNVVQLAAAITTSGTSVSVTGGSGVNTVYWHAIGF